MTGTRSAGAARRLSIMLVDDHEPVRQAVRSLIETIPDWTICAEASDGPSALELAEQARPDVVVLDVSVPRMNGFGLMAELRRILPEVEILALTMHDSEQMVTQALKAGARGYVLKTESGARLMEALDALSRRQAYFGASVSETLLQAYLSAPGRNRTAA